MASEHELHGEYTSCKLTQYTLTVLQADLMTGGFERYATLQLWFCVYCVGAACAEFAAHQPKLDACRTADCHLRPAKGPLVPCRRNVP